MERMSNNDVERHAIVGDVSVSFLEEKGGDGYSPNGACAPTETIVVDGIEFPNDTHSTNDEAAHKRKDDDDLGLPSVSASTSSAGNGGSASLPSGVGRGNLVDYLAHHNLVPLFDRMFEECGKRLPPVGASSHQGSSSSPHKPSNDNPVCDGMLDVVGDALFHRGALSTRPCVPPDAALNLSPIGATTHHVRNVFAGKRVLVVLELPQVLQQVPQGPNSGEEVGASVLSLYRLELMCRTIVAIASLACGANTLASNISPRVVVAIVLTPTQGQEDSVYNGRPAGAGMPRVSQAPSGPDDSDDGPMAMSDFDDPADDESRSSPAAPDDEDAVRAAGGVVGGASASSMPPAPPGSALYTLAGMLNGEGVDTEFLPTHTALLAADLTATSAEGGGAGQPAGGEGTVDDARPIRVCFLPSVWAASESSSNPLSAFDPVLAFTDIVVLEGLETMRLRHPLLSFVPKSVGSAMLGAGAALELCALRGLLTCGSLSRRKIEFPSNAAVPFRSATNSKTPVSRGTAHHASMSAMPKKHRILVVGDNEEDGAVSERNLTSRSPLHLRSALEQLAAIPSALEAIVYAFDEIFLVGTAALVWQRVVSKRRQAARDNGEEAVSGSRSKPAFSQYLEWATRTEAAVCALLDAVAFYSPTVPGGCRVVPASDFVFVKKTTSGKSKVDVITRTTWESTEYFNANGQSCPSKFYYADVGPATRAAMVTSIERGGAFVVGFGSLTRCTHHVGGTRAARTLFSAKISEEDERMAMTATAASCLLTACRGGVDRSQVPTVVFGEHWAQAVALEAGVTLPISLPLVQQLSSSSLSSSPQQPLRSPSTTVSPRGGRSGTTSSPLSLAPAALVSHTAHLSTGGTSPNHRGSSTADCSPMGIARRRLSTRSPTNEPVPSPSALGHRGTTHLARPRVPAQACCDITLRRFLRKDRTVQDEDGVVHLSTLPYREAARILGGEAWKNLEELPCSVPTRVTAHRW